MRPLGSAARLFECARYGVKRLLWQLSGIRRVSYLGVAKLRAYTEFLKSLEYQKVFTFYFKHLKIFCGNPL